MFRSVPQLPLISPERDRRNFNVLPSLPLNKTGKIHKHPNCQRIFMDFQQIWRIMKY